MPVFQLTLRGWQPDNVTAASEACIKWVKCDSREVLDCWLNEKALRSLVLEVDANPSPDFDFDDGVDVILNVIGGEIMERWAPSYSASKDPPVCLRWKDFVAAVAPIAAASIRDILFPGEDRSAWYQFADQLGFPYVLDCLGQRVYKGEWLSADKRLHQPPIAVLEGIEDGIAVVNTNPRRELHEFRQKDICRFVLAESSWVRSQEQPNPYLKGKDE